MVMTNPIADMLTRVNALLLIRTNTSAGLNMKRAESV